MKINSYDRAKVGFDRMDEHDKTIWNEAIEAVLSELDETDYHYTREQIRKLKK